jgi:hypothetical protein
MKPILAKHPLLTGKVLIIAFTGESAVCVEDGGQVRLFAAEDLIVWRPSPDFPLMMDERFFAVPDEMPASTGL